MAESTFQEFGDEEIETKIKKSIAKKEASIVEKLYYDELELSPEK